MLKGGQLGNKGGGRKSIVKEFLCIKNFDIYQQKWWDKLGKLLESKNITDVKFAMVEYNKIQLRRIPQDVDVTTNGESISTLQDVLTILNASNKTH